MDTNILKDIVIVNDGGASGDEMSSSAGFTTGSSKRTADAPEATSSDESPAKRGRKASDIWESLSNEPNPMITAKCACKHCGRKVSHCQKVAYAKSHLLKCLPFIQVIRDTPLEDCPEWYQSHLAAVNESKPTSAQATSANKQTSIRDSMCTVLTPRQKDGFQKLVAEWVFASGTAFARIEDKRLSDAIDMLGRGKNLLPNRKQLSMELLDDVYSELKAKVEKAMKNHVACIISDGWSNIKNEPVINYMAASPTHSLFLESVRTEQQGHSAQYLADDIARVIKKYKDTSFAGAVTDNTSANKLAWQKLRNQFPTCFFQGCASHGLHLLVKDIFGATKTKKAGEAIPTYPTNYPFENLLEFVSSVKDLVNYVRNHHALKAKLSELQKLNGGHELAKACATRWGSIKKMCESVLSNEPSLHTIVSDRYFVLVATRAQAAERTKLKDFVTGPSFVVNLEKVIHILKPVDSLVVKYQSDKVPISEIWPDFVSLSGKFDKLVDENILSSSEHGYICGRIKHRADFMLGVGHGLAYLLDPRYLGEGMSDKQSKDHQDELMKIPENDTDLAVNESRGFVLLQQFTEFTISAGNDKDSGSKHYKALMNGYKTPLQYWQTNGKAWPELQVICKKLFSMSTSSAASERNFSIMKFIHSKDRNRLSPDKVEKLVFIKSNINAMAGIMLDDSDDDSSMSDSDDDN
jgi:Protein of unknown function (DUF 659)/hAT family C-terminal dimerisation region